MPSGMAQSFAAGVGVVPDRDGREVERGHRDSGVAVRACARGLRGDDLAHIGVDVDSGRVDTMPAPPPMGPVSPGPTRCRMATSPMCSGMRATWASYQRDENTDRDINGHIAMRPGKRKTLRRHRLVAPAGEYQHARARLGVKGEHPFHVVRNLFRHRKTDV